MLLHGEFNVLEVEHVESFDVRGDCRKTRADTVGERMDLYKHRTKTKPVLIIISLAGIKVCDRLGQCVLMAYPLRRIAYATCSPVTGQFAFLALEHEASTAASASQQHGRQQRCHLFKAASLEQVLEINGAIQRTFGMAHDLLAMMTERSPMASSTAAERPSSCAAEVGHASSVYSGSISSRCGSLRTSSGDYVEARPPRSSFCAPHRRPSAAAARCSLDCGGCRRSGGCLVAAPGYGGCPVVAAGPVRYCYNNSYNYVEIRAPPPPTSDYQKCTSQWSPAPSNSYAAGATSTDTYVEASRLWTDFARSSMRGRRHSNASQEVENYLCPLQNQADDQSADVGAAASATTEHYDEQGAPEFRREFAGGDCCTAGGGCIATMATSRGMPLRYQNDSPFRGLGEHSDSLPLVSPLRVDSLTKSNTKPKENTIQAVDILKQVPWFQPEMPRERVTDMLGKEEIGSFVVRNSSTHAGCFALSVKVPKFDNPAGIGHYLIQRTPSGGVKVKGLEKEWSSLAALVVHHTIMPELLPCTLVMPEGASRNPCAAASSANDDYDNSRAYGSSGGAAACAASALRAHSTPPPRAFSTYGVAAREGVFSSPSGEMKLK